MNETRFAHRAVPPQARLIWLERLRDWYGAFFVVAMLLAMAGWYVYWRVWEARDVAGAPVQMATAKVVDWRVRDLRGRVGNGWDITLRLKDRDVVAHTVYLPLVSRLAVGKTVDVIYRVGKSGRVVVDDVAETDKDRAATNPAAR